DFLRLLFAKGGRTYCPKCDIEVREDTPQSVMQHLLEKYPGERVYVVAPMERRSEVTGEALVGELLRAGFTRLFTGEGDRPFIELDTEEGPQAALPLAEGDTLRLLIDRLAITEDDLDRISSAIATAFRAGQDVTEVYVVSRKTGKVKKPLVFHQGFRCNGCGKDFQRPEPN